MINALYVLIHRGRHIGNLLITRFLCKIFVLLRSHFKARTSNKFLVSILIQNPLYLFIYLLMNILEIPQIFSLSNRIINN